MAAMDALMMGREAAAVGRMSMAEEAAFIAGGEGGMGRSALRLEKVRQCKDLTLHLQLRGLAQLQHILGSAKLSSEVFLYS
jgi:hypothetical protein